MKNKEFHKLLRKNRSKSNSGFTLTELLVGLIMSIFVVGALGFGLMTVLRATQSETSKVKARNETSRALDFISDEVRRASTIETNASNATGFDDTGRTVVLALDIPEVNTSATLGSDADATTQERIVYYLQSPNTTNWEGPLVLYRYGPPLDANGNYADGDWDEEALIDGIDDTTVTAASPCGSDTLTPSVAKGFYACINGGNTAQLFLTGGTDTAAGVATDTYTADTKVVARARTAPANKTNIFNSYTMSYKTLGATYNCNPSDNSMWKMRTDFGNNPSDSDDTTSWIHQDDRQPQPIKIDTSRALTITSVPVAPPSGVDCISRGDETATGDSNSEPLSAYSDTSRFPNGHTVDHTINFTGTDYWHTFNGDPKTGTRDVIDVKGNGTVLMLKRGSLLAASLDGYDYDDDGAENQASLGEFLKDKGYADFTNSLDATEGYTINNKLGTDERIMAVEVGHTDTSQPGYDVQDSVFILASDIFAKGHENE